MATDASLDGYETMKRRIIKPMRVTATMRQARKAMDSMRASKASGTKVRLPSYVCFNAVEYGVGPERRR